MTTQTALSVLLRPVLLRTAALGLAAGLAACGGGESERRAEVEIHRIAVDHERVLDEDQVHHLAGPLREVLDRC